MPTPEMVIGTASGGGIFNEPVGNATMTASVIAENEAAQDGGGIYNFGGRVTLIDAVVEKNEAGQAGGGAFNERRLPSRPGVLALQGSVIRENDAQDDGGGILNTRDGVVTLDAQSAVADNAPNNCVGTDAC